MKRYILIASLPFFLTPQAANSADAVQSRQARFQVETVASELAYPWSVAFLPRDEFLITERDGKQ